MLKAVRACACRLGVNKHAEEGFTIVELMIALSVLSTILVTASVVMIQVGNLYVKGVNAADLQNINRTVVNDITSALQFSGSTPACVTAPSSNCQSLPDGTMAFCINSTRYTYILDREQGSDQFPRPGQPAVPHVLWRDSVPSTTCQAQAPPTAGGYDMLPDHMRITQFDIQATDKDVYKVTVSLAYGDSDLLSQDELSCNGGSGQQFCATSTISATVTRRAQ